MYYVVYYTNGVAHYYFWGSEVERWTRKHGSPGYTWTENKEDARKFTLAEAEERVRKLQEKHPTWQFVIETEEVLKCSE